MNPDSRYIHRESAEEVGKKGFSVYPYLDPSELVGTVRKDYLHTLGHLNLIFSIVTIVMIFVAYFAENYTFFAFYLAGAYGLIFLYLFIRLIGRTYIFFLIRYVVYTHKGLILGNDLFYYRDESEFSDKLDEYAETFNEYLSEESVLEDNLDTGWQKLSMTLFGNLKTFATSFFKHGSWDGDSFVIAILAFLAYVVHVILIIIFYFAGLLAGYAVFGLYAAIISLFLLLVPSRAMMMKNAVTEIDAGLLLLDETYEEISKKVATFTEGEISEISGFMATRFNRFYDAVADIMKRQKKLQKLIERSKYAKFIDFAQFSEYLKRSFNRPLNDIIGLLEQTRAETDRKLLQVAQIYADTNEDGKAQLDLKRARLEMMQDNISQNLTRLKMSLL